MAAVGSSGGRMQGYRTRRPMRALVLVVILSSAAGLVWLSVLHQTENGCRSPGPTAAGQIVSGRQLPADSLDAVPPAPPQFTRVRVLNANGRPGEATVVDAALAQFGFASTTTPANDPLHPDLDLRCYGEIRFGAAGQGAARTLSLAVPCAELVRDVRPDSDIDLALGTKFIALRPNGAARTALLDSAGLGRLTRVVPPRGGLAAQPEPPSMAQSTTSITQSAVPVMDPSILRQARQVTC
ncbi:MAG: envelope integrity protein Cei [Pseudonocardiaceae bacterium]